MSAALADIHGVARLATPDYRMRYKFYSICCTYRAWSTPAFFPFIYIPIRAAFGNSRLLQTERPKTPSPVGDRVVKGFRQNSTLCTFVYRMLSRRGCTAVAQMACAAPDIYVGRLELCQQIIICYVRGYTNSIYLSNKHTKRT